MRGRSFLLMLSMWVGVVHAYPTRPVTIVIPLTAAGAPDVLARILAQSLQTRLGGSFVVESRPGGGTSIGSASVARAAPDGHTLLMATSSSLAINVTLQKALPYDPVADFVPLAAVAQSPFVLIVNPAVPARSVQELVAHAKGTRLAYGSGGTGAAHHLFAEMFKRMTGIEATHVPYKGSLPALNDVIAGHVALMFCDVPSSAGAIAAGKVRALGVTTKARLVGFPEIPTLAEAGVSGYDAAAWLMLAAPAKTPQATVELLHRELAAILASAEVRERIAKLSLVQFEPMGIPELQRFVKGEIARWGEVVRQAGVAGSE